MRSRAPSRPCRRRCSALLTPRVRITSLPDARGSATRAAPPRTAARTSGDASVLASDRVGHAEVVAVGLDACPQLASATSAANAAAIASVVASAAPAARRSAAYSASASAARTSVAAYARRSACTWCSSIALAAVRDAVGRSRARRRWRRAGAGRMTRGLVRHARHLASAATRPATSRPAAAPVRLTSAGSSVVPPRPPRLRGGSRTWRFAGSACSAPDRWASASRRPPRAPASTPSWPRPPRRSLDAQRGKVEKQLQKDVEKRQAHRRRPRRAARAPRAGRRSSTTSPTSTW